VRIRSKSVSCVLGLLLAASACGFEGDLPTPTKPRVTASKAEVALSLSSAPINAVGAADESASWSAEWTVTVQETAGVGVDIELVRGTLTDSEGATIAETVLDEAALTAQMGGSNHLRGRSKQDIPMTLTFDFPTDVFSGDFRVTVQLSDDRGNALSAEIATVLQVCVPGELIPEEAAIMDNGCTNGENGVSWEFDWAECEGAEAYEIYLDHSTLENALQNDRLTDSSFTLLNDRVVPEESRFEWVWRVRAKLKGNWGNWTPDMHFDVEPVNTDCVRP
jgi:hypothetical protein